MFTSIIVHSKNITTVNSINSERITNYVMCASSCFLCDEGQFDKLHMVLPKLHSCILYLHLRKPMYYFALNSSTDFEKTDFEKQWLYCLNVSVS